MYARCYSTVRSARRPSLCTNTNWISSLQSNYDNTILYEVTLFSSDPRSATAATHCTAILCGLLPVFWFDTTQCTTHMATNEKRTEEEKEKKWISSDRHRRWRNLWIHRLTTIIIIMKGAQDFAVRHITGTQSIDLTVNILFCMKWAHICECEMRYCTLLLSNAPT